MFFQLIFYLKERKYPRPLKFQLKGHSHDKVCEVIDFDIDIDIGPSPAYVAFPLLYSI
jgi:hypothetical protein